MELKIVVPAYRRPKSLKRLLESLLVAVKTANNFSVLVSLDGGYALEVLAIAEVYKKKFPKDKFEFFIHSKNIGLRNHILWCGNLSQEFEAIVVLEDDLLVDKYFSLYVEKAVHFYSDEEAVAGISLYSQQFNEFANLPFYPSMTEDSALYFMQVPCSWGQVWTRHQWSGFYEWYSENLELNLTSIIELPYPARNWPNSSWKKYFYAYLALKNKYIAYPFRSYTTNCSDQGGHHNKNGINFLQVPLLNREPNKCETHFSKFNESKLKYDGYFERIEFNLSNSLVPIEIKPALDIYASKPLEYLKRNEFVLTTRKVKNSIAQYPLKYKPIELNFQYPDERGAFGISLARTEDVLEKTILHSTYIKFNLAQYFSPFDLAQLEILTMQIIVKLSRIMHRTINLIKRTKN